ncbi:lytic transglycosylase domain-containing protein [Pusillimonas sp. DMV24BSW_D]|uniref:lytic transglycosylase domain-containing protein n=1 Tax=Neopusillimonas aestuarii TaxID=2716226 RepID=UPI001409489E|nr:lytic transglycosylase domain-containing protein [Pusillimonas sp. DMV24BSW_D]QIM48603.1 lytic transglycosylase domain-containing protein [Pusillimonas sp. DMV24BSW_D]
MVFKQCQRYQKLWRRAGLGLLLAGVLGSAGLGPAAAQEDVEVINITIRPDPSLQAVIQAREAMQRKRWDELEALVPQASQAPLLGSYAEYWLLRRDLTNPATPVPTQRLERFMATNEDAYLADRIRSDWIVAAARSGDYAKAVELAPVVASNSQVDCAVLLSRHMLGERVNGQVAVDTFEPVSLCWMMLDELVDKNIVGWKQLETMLRATLETSKTGNARRLAALMFDAGQMKSYAAFMKNPRQWLAGQQAPKTTADIALVTLALSRLARNDREVETAYIQNNWVSSIPKADLEWVWGQFGLIAALNVEPNAVQWYRRSGNIPKTDYNHAWEVRSELRQAPIDWVQVSRAIQKMTPRQQAEPVWVYWYGRSLAAQGNEAAARQYYQSIQNDYSFYGQLANEELGQPIPIPPAPAPVTAQELAEARANPGLQRGIKLFDLGWRAEAVPEWNFTLRGMTDRQLLAAAELAREEQIFDRVVNTSLRTSSIADFSQRFVAPFEGRVSAKAREINLDPAWVYGLIRQESRFITDARSRVGASGLMQLMPATARWVARKIGMSDFNPSRVNDFDVNTILGTQYLKMVLDDLDGSQVLATAGYNAGPGRSKQWRAKLLGPVEGAVFAETIPFTETRLYVKHVLSNAVYYAMLFSGQPQSLKARLDTISPNRSRRTNLP